MTMERPLRGKRILLLEDDYYLATDEKASLERAGADVVGPYGRGCDQGDLDAAWPVDAAVLDINLGTGPEFGLAQLLSERRVPFVFVTGYDKAVIPEAMSHVPRLEKPIRERDLIAMLADLAAERAS